ncbi:SRPBCC family protein [Auraticoccus monumenti]|uniref:Polyketide cyclase / dehydrase and lipid transport n=1 Tax=Auraticoccus monumenti TaxID=675864 RepID=A0A1G6Z1Q5_9ACTN|nr:SRPBCC family protein [Auraticoccus monumenti]SDD95746.1 Polyketide cyclase / dehydrase and lipid transport [Auraticoccus monumenti]
MSWTVAVAGPLPADEAWQRYADLRRWSDWSPQIRSVEASSTALVTGMTGTVRSLGPTALPFTVESVDAAARRWSWRVGIGPATVRMEHAIEARGDGCVATLTVHAPLPLAFGYAQACRPALHRLTS